MSNIILTRPVFKIPDPFTLTKRDEQGSSFSLLTQLFGECLPSVCSWYHDLGLTGHNGLDFMVAYVDCFASHDGTVFKTLDKDNSSPTAGYGVYIRHDEGWWTLYFHLKEVKVKVGQKVKAGDLIGVTGNTGKYTVGAHLHFALYPAIQDNNNGYGGAIDPLPYFSKEQITGIINTMKLKSNNGNVYLVDEQSKFAWSIPNPELLAEIVNHFALIGKPLEAEEPFDIIGYFTICGSTPKSLREYFNL